MQHILDRGLLTGEEVDHINMDTLDNRRANLRIANRTQQRANQQKRRDAVMSCFKGVYKMPKLRSGQSRKKPWQVRCGRHHIGYYATEIEAAVAYDRAARTVFGEFARTNFPGEDHANH